MFSNVGLEEEEERSIVQSEPLLTETNSRFVLYPIQYQKIWEFYKKAVASFWTVEEIDLEVDKAHFRDKLNDNERSFIENVLAAQMSPGMAASLDWSRAVQNRALVN